MNRYDVIVVGAGQAGLAMGYYLKQAGLSFLLVDSHQRIGDSWRKRYNSLVLFTPRKYSSLPGLLMSGSPEGFPTKDEIADYLEEYTAHFHLPVQLETFVKKVEKCENLFEIETTRGTLKAGQVVVASGAFQKPFIPPVISEEERMPLQLHSSSYLVPNQLSEGAVLVVGGGNSGAQIAVELAADREVTLAVNHPFKFLPLRFLSKSIFSWLEWAGLLYAGIDTKKGEWFRRQSDPIFGKELKNLLKKDKVTLKPKVVCLKGMEATFEDGSMASFPTIIWSTGFVPSYEWIQIQEAIDLAGKPIHQRGISPVKGLYFIGLPWQYQRGSALICGVGRDAAYLLSPIVEMKKR
ncbi:oxidoreductase [Bacillus sp. FJAT-27231]|uniref:flavin-containing monooxygenase n=1 Tax=Bacillus sp. FJAT-27231 TaxID=1679168 RepID=UPI00067152D0|nr:NAD(P)/FAD-dependent oxidoreductase [Bacillus sp. FJAT-27231]KMY55570.1 oxidoreductase [Bacillus sp. FJAT-27231]